MFRRLLNLKTRFSRIKKKGEIITDNLVKNIDTEKRIINNARKKEIETRDIFHKTMEEKYGKKFVEAIKVIADLKLRTNSFRSKEKEAKIKFHIQKIINKVGEKEANRLINAYLSIIKEIKESKQELSKLKK